MRNFRWDIVIRYGLMAAIITAILSFATYFFYEFFFGKSLVIMTLVGVAFLVISLFFGVWAGVNYRKENEGLISFPHALLAVFLVMSMQTISSTACSTLINKVIDPSWAGKVSSLMKEKMTEQFEKAGMSDADIEKSLERVDETKFNPSIPEIAQKLAVSLIFTLFISLIIAAFIKRNSQDFVDVSQIQ